MAMTPQLWTINGLATELGKDRRTLGKALRHVPTDGTTRGGHRGWHMESALRALSNRGQARSEVPPTPPGFEVIERLENPAAKAQLLTIMYFRYRIGWMAASMAVMAGAPMKSAYTIFHFMGEAFAMEAELVCAVWDLGDIQFTEDEVLNPDLVEKPDWEHLAKLAGEPVDMQTWHAWAQERGRGKH